MRAAGLSCDETGHEEIATQHPPVDHARLAWQIDSERHQATPNNMRVKWGAVHTHPVMAREGRPSTTFLRASGKVVDGRLSRAMTGWAVAP
jgi:hypothetical protein